MIRAIRTLLTTKDEPTALKPISSSPDHSDSKSIFAFNSKSSKPSKQSERPPIPNSVEIAIEEVDVLDEEFDFETFHKNINQQKVKTAQVCRC